MLDLATMRAEYARTESATDAYGRSFEVGRLKPSEENRLFRMLGDEMNRFTFSSVARVAQVRAVISPDGTETRLGFPRDVATAESLMDAWGDPGLRAVSEAIAKLDEKDADGAAISEDQQTKNS